LQLHETADWIIDTHLRELHPLLWLKGAHWLFLESQELTHDQKPHLGKSLSCGLCRSINAMLMRPNRGLLADLM